MSISYRKTVFSGYYFYPFQQFLVQIPTSMFGVLLYWMIFSKQISCKAISFIIIIYTGNCLFSNKILLLIRVLFAECNILDEKWNKEDLGTIRIVNLERIFYRSEIVLKLYCCFNEMRSLNFENNNWIQGLFIYWKFVIAVRSLEKKGSFANSDFTRGVLSNDLFLLVSCWWSTVSAYFLKAGMNRRLSYFYSK